MPRNQRFKAGQWVRVKSREEILRTLDENGRLDGLPFMPEMLPWCGKRMQVFKRAHKTCDPPNGLAGRSMANAVHLEGVRCDGSAHDGCQAGCLMFWKYAWLEPDDGVTVLANPPPAIAGRGCDESTLWSVTRVSRDEHGTDSTIYVCQSTDLSGATQPLRWWDPRQYVEDLTSGNVSMGQLFAAFLFTLYRAIAEAGLGLGSAMRCAYDRFQTVHGGTPYPARFGRIPAGTPTPTATLNLRAGEHVRVKKYSEILDTLNDKSHNRGMYFDPEEVPFCGKTYEVLMRVERIIDEKSGSMLKLKSDAIILKDVACLARYARCRKFCPRSIYPYWREIWLDREAD